jgi:hypothetical protein
MRTHLRFLVIGTAALAFGFWVLAGVGSGVADDKKDKKDKKDKGPNEELRKIADAFEKGDLAAAKTQGKAVADKSELEDVMHLFSPRKADGEGGEGIGTKPGAIKPDCIEVKIQYLGKRVAPQELKNDNAALQRMAFITAAVAEVAQHKCPVDKKTGEKDPAKWKKWTEEMRESALELAKAVKASDAMAVKKTALRLDGTCRNCHGVFRDDK